MLKDLLEIDGIVFDVTILSIKENATVLYTDNTQRTLAIGARMILDPLGTFIGHRITIKRNGDKVKEYDRLFNYVIQPRSDAIKVKVVHDQSMIEYEAYISSAEREVQKVDINNNKVYWKQLEINIIPIEAQVIPYG